MFLRIKIDKIGETCLRGELQKPFMQKTHLSQMVVSGSRKSQGKGKLREALCLLENQDGKLEHLDIANTAECYYLGLLFSIDMVFKSFLYISIKMSDGNKGEERLRLRVSPHPPML